MQAFLHFFVEKMQFLNRSTQSVKDHMPPVTPGGGEKLNGEKITKRSYVSHKVFMYLLSNCI